MAVYLFNKKMIRKCGYCLKGDASGDGNTILCRKKGVMPADDYCRGFKYDPLKRVPLKAKSLEKLEL